MRLDLNYGTSTLPLLLPDNATADVFEPRKAPPLTDPVGALRAGLKNPLGCPPLSLAPAPRSIGIAVPDETRPVPLRQLLPPLLDHVLHLWPHLTREDITLVVGGGLHPPADAAQLQRILPNNLGNCRVLAHDAHNTPVTSFGRTSRGTQVEINAAYAATDYKIVLGMVDIHQFVGFTGGAKGVVIGCASAAMIAANHSMLREHGAEAGRLTDNPVRQDLNEAGELAGVHLAVNVVLDAHKRPVALAVGRPALVMEEMARLTGLLYGLSFVQPYDVVIASCGGSPKDICLYQAQKGLNAAMQCAAPGAGIVLLAECEQGVGDEAYESYASQFPDAASLMRHFEQQPFRMGAHKAYLFGRCTERFRVVLHSALPAHTLQACHLTPGLLQDTVDQWLHEKPAARVAVLKNANSSFFVKG